MMTRIKSNSRGVVQAVRDVIKDARNTGEPNSERKGISKREVWWQQLGSKSDNCKKKKRKLRQCYTRADVFSTPVCLHGCMDVSVHLIAIACL